jgi:hypothetical protein
MVAGRAMGTFGSINFADRLLTLAAGPAVSYSWLVVVLVFGMDAEASVGHSHLVAMMSSVLAGAFWLAVGNGVAAARARRAPRGGADRP